MDIRYGKNGNVNSHSPVCGIMWLAIGGLIVALSVLDVGQMPLRETLVYGAQGVIVGLYGWYRLRLAWPTSAEMRTKSTRSQPDRVQMRPYRAQARGQIAAPFPSRFG
jgi:H+/Cl- antiporter ClcA